VTTVAGIDDDTISIITTVTGRLGARWRDSCAMVKRALTDDTYCCTTLLAPRGAYSHSRQVMIVW